MDENMQKKAAEAMLAATQQTKIPSVWVLIATLPDERESIVPMTSEFDFALCFAEGEVFLLEAFAEAVKNNPRLPKGTTLAVRRYDAT